MLRIPMPELRRRGVVVPGGWIAKIPSIRGYDAEEAAHVRYYRGKGLHEGAALDHVRTSWEAIWVHGYLQALGQAVADMAKKYKKIHPDLGLRGFDPEKAQAGYVPGDNTGVRGKPAVTELLRRMGTDQRAKESRTDDDEG